MFPEEIDRLWSLLPRPIVLIDSQGHETRLTDSEQLDGYLGDCPCDAAYDDGWTSAEIAVDWLDAVWGMRLLHSPAIPERIGPARLTEDQARLLADALDDGATGGELYAMIGAMAEALHRSPEAVHASMNLYRRRDGRM